MAAIVKLELGCYPASCYASFQYYDVASDGTWVASGEWGQANTCIDPGAICPPIILG